MNDIELYVRKILDIIKFDGDKEAFVDKFLNNIYYESFLSIVEKVSDEKKTLIFEEIEANKDNSQILAKVMSTLVTEAELADIISEVAERQLSEFLIQIENIIDEDQKERIALLLQ